MRAANARPPMDPDRSPEDLHQATAFVQKLGRALHLYGAPAHRLEAVLQALSGKLGLRGEFFSTPSAIFYAYDVPGEAGVAHLQRVFGQDLHLEKLADLDTVFNRVMDGELSLREATAEVDRIEAAPSRYPTWSTWLAFALTSFAAVRLFGGGWAEMLLAGLAGASLATLYLLAGKFAAVGRLFEPLGALVVAFAAYGSAGWLGASADLALLAGLVVLVPGFSLTIGATELAMKHPVSGVGRLAGATMTVMMLGMGVLFGRWLAIALVGEPPVVEPEMLPAWTEGAVLLLAGVSLAVLFRVAPRDIVWATGAVLAPWVAFQLGVEEVGRDGSVFLGALIAGLLSNVYSRTLNRPAVVVRLPGILILVPGVTSFLSVTALLEGETLAGVESLFRVIAASMALVVGFLVANVALPPRKAL